MNAPTRYDPAASDLPPAACTALDTIRGHRGSVPPMFLVLAADPALALEIEGLSSRLWNCDLSRASLEAVFLMVAVHFRCDTQWQRHAERARAEGVAEDCLAAIREGRALPTAASVPSELRMCCLLAAALLGGQPITDALWGASLEALGKRAMAQLCAFLSMATLVSMTLRLQQVA